MERILAAFPDFSATVEDVIADGDILAAFPDFSATVEDVIADGDTVAMRVMLRGSHEGSSWGSNRRAGSSRSEIWSSRASMTGRSPNVGSSPTPSDCCGNLASNRQRRNHDDSDSHRDPRRVVGHAVRRDA